MATGAGNVCEHDYKINRVILAYERYSGISFEDREKDTRTCVAVEEVNRQGNKRRLGRRRWSLVTSLSRGRETSPSFQDSKRHRTRR